MPLFLDLGPHETPVETVQVTHKDDTFAIQTHGDVLLIFCKGILKLRAQPALATGVQIDAKPGWRVSLEGHTDSIGADAVNLDPSKRRGMAVLGWLTTTAFFERPHRNDNIWAKPNQSNPTRHPATKTTQKERGSTGACKSRTSDRERMRGHETVTSTILQDNCGRCRRHAPGACSAIRSPDATTNARRAPAAQPRTWFPNPAGGCRLLLYRFFQPRNHKRVAFTGS